MRHLPLRLIKGNENATRARAREADHSNDHSRRHARGVNNISNEPQQKGGLKNGLKTICTDNMLIINVLFEYMVRSRRLELPLLLQNSDLNA